MLTITVGFCGFLFPSNHYYLVGTTFAYCYQNNNNCANNKNIGLENFDDRRLRRLVDTTLVAGDEYYALLFLQLYQAHLSFHAY